jgi:hypothetical protein
MSLTVNDINYSWSVRNLMVVSSKEGYNNVVERVFWTLRGTYTDNTGKVYSYDLEDISTIKFDVTNATFMDFKSIPAETLISWVIDKENTRFRNVEWRKGQVLEKINELINPTFQIIEPKWL